MPQPSQPFWTGVRQGGVRCFCALALLLVVLIGADIWLLFQFAAAPAIMLAELNAVFFAILAAMGRGIMVAAMLLLTWLLIEDLRDTLRGKVSEGKHNFYTR